MEKVLNKDSIINNLIFERSTSKLGLAKQDILGCFYSKCNIDNLPFELVDVLNNKDMDYINELRRDVLYLLSNVDIVKIKPMLSIFTADSLSIVSRIMDDEKLLEQLLNSNLENVNKLLGMILSISGKRHNSAMDDYDPTLCKYYVRLAILVEESIIKENKWNLEKLIGHLTMRDPFDVLKTYIGRVELPIEDDFYGRPITPIPENIDYRIVEILSSDIYKMHIEHCDMTWGKDSRFYFNWIMYGIDKEALSLIEYLTKLYIEESSYINLNTLEIIALSSIELGTKFNANKLIENYGDRLAVLFVNLIGMNKALISQQVANVLINQIVDVDNPYDYIYDKDTRENRFLKLIPYLSVQNAHNLTMIINDKKVSFLEKMFDFYKDRYKDEDDAGVLASMMHSNIISNYDNLNKLLHLNNLNANQINKLAYFKSSSIRAFISLLDSVKFIHHEIVTHIDKMYNVRLEDSIYTDEKFNFDEFLLLANNLRNKNVAIMLLLLKKLKLKNSRIMNICSEIAKSEIFDLISPQGICKLIDASFECNSLYLYAKRHLEFGFEVNKIDNLLYSIINKEYLNLLTLNSEKDIEFMRKRKADIKHFINLGITDIKVIQREMCLNDNQIKSVLGYLNVGEDFINKYFENILDFYIKGLGTVVYTLKNKLTGQGGMNLPLIVKAELAGALKDIKYVPGDYEKEIGLPVSGSKMALWEKNLVKNNSYEADDFETIIRIGQYPVETCQNWKSSGNYVKSILSNFDTNKKILIHKNSKGKIDTRAIIRLTKMTFDKGIYNLNEYSNQVDGEYFGFKDITKDDSTLSSHTRDKEELVLFLERSYTSLDSRNAKKVYKEFIELAQEKADAMGIRLIISRRYGDELALEEYSTKYCYVYISKSKNGYQYLDSMSGQRTNSDSEKYHETEVYIKK